MAPQLGAVHRSPPLTPPADPSPKGWKRLGIDRRVGLAIVAALETPPPSVIINTAAAASVASSPISIASPRPGRRRACQEASEAWLSVREQETAAAGEVGGFRVADFLSHCHLCRKRLHGKDIYMYRGEKAFCSVECRCQQIISDEYQEICGAEAAEASSSPYSGGGRIFFPGIVVS